MGDSYAPRDRDPNVLVREGVRALVNLESDLEIVGVAADEDELVQGAFETSPQVLVTDIRMPPSSQDEGIEAAKGHGFVNVRDRRRAVGGTFTVDSDSSGTRIGGHIPLDAGS